MAFGRSTITKVTRWIGLKWLGRFRSCCFLKGLSRGAKLRGAVRMMQHADLGQQTLTAMLIA